MDVLSGPGLVNLARFTFAERGEPPPEWLDHPDAPARVVTEEPEVVSWFCGLYGAEAGNMALRVLALGGVYLCGGIAPKLLDALRSGAFQERFVAKGRLGLAIKDIPVYVVLYPGLGLIGAAAEGLAFAE